jgi:signal transduction histidine kinase
MFGKNNISSDAREYTKIKYGIIIISIAIGLAFWVSEAVLDRIFFYDETFWRLLINPIPKHEIYLRLVALISFTIYGIVMTKIISRRILAEKELKAANQQLQANEQQLRAANQQLQANEQQLRAANQQLQANEQQLRAANQQLQANEQQLRAANQQLEANNQQLKASHKEISVLARFPGESPNPVLRIGKDGTIIYSNDAGLKLITECSTQVGSRLPEKWCKFTADVFSSGMKEDTEFAHGDHVFSVTFVPIVDLDYVNIYAHEITKRKQAEDELRKYQRKLKAMASRLSSTQERERRKLAVEMHDRVTQKLSMVKFELEKSISAFKDKNTNVAREVKGIAGQIGKTIEDAYSLMLELSNPILYEIGFKEAVEALLQSDIIRNRGIKGRLIAPEEPLKLDTELSVILYQGVREALTNVVKHAKAKNVEVKIQNESDIVRITIEDDGIGFDASQKKALGRKGGFGLFSIRESVEGFGGKLTVKPKAGNGTSVILTMPI